jgi:hypothetical protein
MKRKTIMRIKTILLLLISAVVVLAACSSEEPLIEPTNSPPTVTPIPAPTSTSTLVPDPPALPIDLTDVGPITPTIPINNLTISGFTYQRADGNRLAEGVGSVGKNNPVDIKLDGTPRWVVGVPLDGGGSIWSIVFEDGNVQSYFQMQDEITPINVQPNQLPPGMPPLLIIHRGAPRLLTAPRDDASPLTHPVVIKDNPANFAYIAINGDVVINKGGDFTRLEVNALPDARILQDEQGRLLVLTGATTSYSHGVLGDAIEASTITLINTDTTNIETVIDVTPKVVEGISAIWADLDEDGQREIIVTLSDENDGGQIVVYDESGNLKEEGPGIGRGYRWRHQLVVAPFEAGRAPMLADNLTPHIGGITEFYSLNPETGLNIVSSASGFSTHRLGSRNLDMAVAGDLDGDGTIELMIPSESGEYLGAFQFRNGFANVAWTISIPGQLVTNIGSVTMLDGSLALAAGFENGTLRLWLP